ncbi:RNA polymerase sigma factor [Acetobacter senegalensis]|uniref:RNA polymerase sigma factor n=1 Tax=Acetobacter senegalensis TaxID=446692 RepID=UPI001EDB30EC|nr:sigma-70 family RNA polymerase sigma factor [Acetobacter senegalensis]MCG4258443.1 sigma-70 family RNA polymerase sigma factor [Acetobacter senegalensis]MCG4261810.1 sigma-70 family RNA polymerase sigma factor [Acetobacter senegalensis]MCG4268411.1 sigma-70 family RNA polymerase sigma factor [Acetobacter senegalensis]MCG4274629.1 sigma-70 family RNA polymerase sigma factor [Acetobacter senegalensis]MCP1195812.1 sigma-70 family RNA polymerase sigma factor [Acetobacter senegalensis]
MSKRVTKNWLPQQQVWAALRQRIRALTHRDDAEDHLQSAFVNYLEREGEPVREPHAYITRSAINLARNAHKREQTGYVTLTEDSLPPYFEIADPAPSQEEVYASRQRLAHFRAGCSQLPEKTRLVFLLHRVKKMKYQEIANISGMSVSSVEKHIAKALTFLSAWMEQ